MSASRCAISSGFLLATFGWGFAACTFASVRGSPGQTTQGGGGKGGGGQVGSGQAGGGPDAGSPTPGTAGTSPLPTIDAAAPLPMVSDAGGGVRAPGEIPPDFTRVDIGAWKLGDPVKPTAGTQMGDTTPSAGCNEIVGIVRDFKGFGQPGGHPDFQRYAGSAPTVGLVEPTLGADRKPVYASKCEVGTMPLDAAACPYGPQTTSKMAFDQWYRTIDGVNAAYQLSFIFVPNNGVTTFEAEHFWPVDSLDGGKKNGAFTTELHMKFKYRGGEKFTFRGDDDLWVFVNGKLALDLGGLHPPADGTIDLDTMAAKLGITPNNSYDIELFNAERFDAGSTFRVDTNFEFTNCGYIVP
jgi:fibro-slime domain-containing protein